MNNNQFAETIGLNIAHGLVFTLILCLAFSIFLYFEFKKQEKTIVASTSGYWQLLKNGKVIREIEGDKEIDCFLHIQLIDLPDNYSINFSLTKTLL